MAGGASGVYRGGIAPVAFTDEQRELLRGMREGGATWDQIGAALGVSASRASEEGRYMGLRTGWLRPSVRKPSAVRRDYGGEPLGVWHEVSRAVLGEAGLPVPGVGEVW